MDKSLPNVSAYSHPTTEDLIFVMKGQSGYWSKSSVGIVDDELTPETWNEAHGVTKAEAEAMFCGSMWGWDCPASKASNYDSDGKMIINRLDD